MKATAEVTGIKTIGDSVEVTAQFCKGAEWRRMETITITLPPYLGQQYRVGCGMDISVRPKRR